jgi:hypothetical protein
MSNTQSLLPCPFCGCKAAASVNKGESLWSHDVVDWTRVHCTNDDCNAQTEATCEGYEPSAVEVWNLRTPQPVVREPRTCEWTHNDDDGYWDTSCGKAWRFDDGGPKENNMNFCHCCGKTLRIKGGQHGTE